jgi:hypothetical protein
VQGTCRSGNDRLKGNPGGPGAQSSRITKSGIEGYAAEQGKDPKGNKSDRHFNPLNFFLDEGGDKNLQGMKNQKEKTKDESNGCGPLGNTPSEEFEVKSCVDLDQVAGIGPGKIEGNRTKKNLGGPLGEIQKPKGLLLFAFLKILPEHFHVEVLAAPRQQTRRDKNQIEEKNHRALFKPANVGKKEIPQDNHGGELKSDNHQNNDAGPIGKLCDSIG